MKTIILTFLITIVCVIGCNDYREITRLETQNKKQQIELDSLQSMLYAADFLIKTNNKDYTKEDYKNFKLQ